MKMNRVGYLQAHARSHSRRLSGVEEPHDLEVDMPIQRAVKIDPAKHYDEDYSLET